MNQRFCCVLGIFAIVLGTGGCTAVGEKKPKHNFFVGFPDKKRNYKPVDASNLTLKMISRPVVTASTRCFLTFAVTNTGNKRIEISEWLRAESDNLVIYAQPWLTQMTGPDPDGWIKLEVEKKKPVYHYPMILMPGNQALVTKELPFIEKLRIPPDGERRFFIRAESNLSSLKLVTGVIALRVLPKPLPKNNQEAEK